MKAEEKLTDLTPDSDYSHCIHPKTVSFLAPGSTASAAHNSVDIPPTV